MRKWESERRLQNQLELERIRRAREEREAQAAARLDERDGEQRRKEMDSLGANWEEKEHQFHQRQLALKIYKRIDEGTAEMVHLLALPTLNLASVKTESTHCYLLKDERLSHNKLVYDHEAGREAFLAYERDNLILKYWNSLRDYVHITASANDAPGPITTVVSDDIEKVLSNKSYEQLLDLEKGVLKKLNDPTADGDYWNELIGRLRIKLAASAMDKYYRLLQERQLKAADGLKLTVKRVSLRDADFSQNHPMPSSDLRPRHVPDTGVILSDECTEAWDLLQQEENRKVGSDELPFNNEAEDIPFSTPAWRKGEKDRIRMVKPRFFNRVRMNYEWNKYNQTHYDLENPPPKVVQGFRFNVFYPLCSQAPDFRIESDPSGSADTSILRFISKTEPYTDLVFRIPNDEWDRSSKHGYKCIFERGALRLHFWFRSQRYRR